MKITQKRKVNRYMSFFRNNFGFRVPFQVLIDGPFCLAALEAQVRVAEQLPKYFQCEIKLLTTQCVILEMEKIGPAVVGGLRICKQFSVHKCGHEKSPIAASKCLESMIRNNDQEKPDRYIIATQDPELREVARSIPGTPILYLYFRSPTLEKPSDSSIQLAGMTLQATIRGKDSAMERLQKLKEKELGDTSAEVKRIKRRKAKGPNPLSCKKKKKKTSTSNIKKSTEEAPAKRKRKRIKIAQHIRQELNLQKPKAPTEST